MQERKHCGYKMYLMFQLTDKDGKAGIINILNKVKQTKFPTHENLTKGMRSLSHKATIHRTKWQCGIWDKGIRKQCISLPCQGTI